jgi:F-type H+-transporting ATPase subunit gamma
MQNVRLIKGRIKSAKSIAQITKAMELVAASKMKKSQAAADAGRLYAYRIREMVMKLGSKVEAVHPLLTKPKTITGKRLAIVISSNKGMCGGLNSVLFRAFYSHYQHFTNQMYVSLGSKGTAFITGMGGQILADFSQHASFVPVVPAVTELVIQEFLSKKYDGVDLIYNEFQSVIKQVPQIKQILPLTIEGLSDIPKEEDVNFLIEPSAEEIFSSLLPHYVENQIRDAILQAEASEHAARMVAMRNATDNANSFIGELTLIYNKARQEKITYEISDMITARAAIME